MEALIGSTIPVFIGLTVCLAGFAAFMTGRALAQTWRPAWHAVPYSMLLGATDRFLHYGLFDGDLLSLGGYVVDTAYLIVVALATYRIFRVRKMVDQYPWLYERAGLMGYREKRGAA